MFYPDPKALGERKKKEKKAEWARPERPKIEVKSREHGVEAAACPLPAARESAEVLSLGFGACQNVLHYFRHSRWPLLTLLQGH